jgi:hypothetical protein
MQKLQGLGGFHLDFKGSLGGQMMCECQMFVGSPSVGDTWYFEITRKTVEKIRASLRERTCGLKMARSQGQSCPSLLELTSWHHAAQMQDTKSYTINICPAEFGFALFPSLFPMPSFLLLRMRMFTLFHCILGICNFHLILYGLTVKSWPWV